MTDEIDDDDADTQWTPPARQQLLAVADELIAAIRAHADALVEMRGGAAETPDLLDANTVVARVAATYSDAVFDLTGASVPFDADLIEDDDDDEDDGDDEDDPEDWSAGVSVLRRDDYAVTDEDRVVADGRAAYLEAWPDETDEDAAVAVPGVGRAVLEVMHARGSDALIDVDGLRPLVKHTVIVGTEEVSEPGTWEEDPFAPFGPGHEVLAVSRE